MADMGEVGIGYRTTAVKMVWWSQISNPNEAPWFRNRSKVSSFRIQTIIFLHKDSALLLSA